jgi:flagellar basal-body rod protein FlgF
MDRGVYAIVSGAIGQERRMDVVAKNLANAQTVGYKQEKTLFSSLLSKSVTGGHRKTQADKVFSRVGGSFLDWKSGTGRPTGQATDLTLDGEGFFVVKTPRGPEYTRAGNFVLNDKQQLVTLDGAPILGQSGPMQIPAGKLLVNGQGEITVDGATVDTLKVVKFKDLASSVRVGERFITQGGVVPAPETSVRQGRLEESNVNAVEQLIALIEINRQYEAAQKVIRSMDEAAHLAVTDIAQFA